MRIRRIRAAAIGIALFLLAQSAVAPARAHPHVWITSQLHIIVDDQQRWTELGVTWTFDDFSSVFLIEDMARDAQGNPTPQSLQAWADMMLSNIEEWHYYVDISDAGTGDPLPIGRAKNATARWHDGLLTVSFQVPLGSPPELTGSRHAIRVYDPTYYIDIAFQRPDGVLLPPAMASVCGIAIDEPEPATAEAALLSTLDATQTPPSGMGDVGSLFAEIASIDCRK